MKYDTYTIDIKCGQKFQGEDVTEKVETWSQALVHQKTFLKDFKKKFELKPEVYLIIIPTVIGPCHIGLHHVPFVWYSTNKARPRFFRYGGSFMVGSSVTVSLSGLENSQYPI